MSEDHQVLYLFTPQPMEGSGSLVAGGRAAVGLSHRDMETVKKKISAEEEP